MIIEDFRGWKKLACTILRWQVDRAVKAMEEKRPGNQIWGDHVGNCTPCAKYLSEKLGFSDFEEEVELVGEDRERVEIGYRRILERAITQVDETGRRRRMWKRRIFTVAIFSLLGLVLVYVILLRSP